MVVSERQQCQETRAFDRCVELTLVNSLRTRQTGWDNLAVFLNEITQSVDIFVIDLVDTRCAKAAKFAALE